MCVCVMFLACIAAGVARSGAALPSGIAEPAKNADITQSNVNLDDSVHVRGRRGPVCTISNEGTACASSQYCKAPVVGELLWV